MFSISLVKPPVLSHIFFLYKFLASFLPAYVLFFHITIIFWKNGSKVTIC